MVEQSADGQDAAVIATYMWDGAGLSKHSETDEAWSCRNQGCESQKPPESSMADSALVSMNPPISSNAGDVADSSSDSDDTARVSVYMGECNYGKMASCTNLGTFYRMGWGVPRDLLRAGALYKKGCDGGDANGCLLLKDFGAR